VGERGRTPPVDFCNRYDPRARPRTSELRSTAPAVARWCSSLSAVTTFRRCAELRMARPTFVSRPVENSRVRGLAETRRSLGRLLPPRPLAVKALPQPDRLGHPLSQARDDPPPGDVDVVGSCAPATSLPRCPGAHAPARPGARCRGLRRIGPPCPPSREGDRAPLHPRCLPSPDRPFLGVSSHLPQAVPSLWSVGRRLFDLRPFPGPVTKA
jgi:hypothetical protein